MPSFKTIISVPAEVEYQTTDDPHVPVELLSIELTPVWKELFQGGMKPHQIPDEMVSELIEEAKQDAANE